jgi:hypothetical protein
MFGVVEGEMVGGGKGRSERRSKGSRNSQSGRAQRVHESEIARWSYSANVKRLWAEREKKDVNRETCSDLAELQQATTRSRTQGLFI